MNSNLVTFGAVCLRPVGDVVSWQRPKPDYTRSVQPAICISTCSRIDEGAFVPAQSVWVTGRDNLSAVRAAIDEALKEE
jgi:hypothetical protein